MDTRRIITWLVCLMACFTLLWNVSVWAKAFKVLILDGAADGKNNEASRLETLTEVEGNTFTFDEIGINWQGNTLPVPDSIVIGEAVENGEVDFMQYDIIWFTWNGPGHDGDYFMEGAEEAIVEFVREGGGVWVSAFDDNYQDQNGRQIGGWMPLDEFPATIQNTGDSATEITPEGEASGLFDNPNKVDLDAATLDDNYAGVGDEWLVLATRTDNSQPAAFRLPYGKGSYVGVCIDARSTFPAAEPLLENALAYFARLKVGMAVELAGKLAATWGRIKSE
jgi:hypothetical protein